MKPVVLAAVAVLFAAPAQAFQEGVLESVVSVLPRYEGAPPPREGPGPTQEPEGTAVVVEDGLLVTAGHVIADADSVTIRLHDGRLWPAKTVGRDDATDLALLRVEAGLAPLSWGAPPRLRDPVCAIGNAFGLGLSLSCGVVSATRVTHAGFNPIEDFIQTDAAVNPGMSGAPLVDEDGRLVGIVTGILTKDADANIGVNFASSRELVERVVADLSEHGEVRRARPGLRLAPLEEAQRRELTGARVVDVVPGGAAEAAGLMRGDVLTRIGDRDIRRPSDAVTAIQLRHPGEGVEIAFRRDRDERRVLLRLPEE